jgi:acetyl esterase/lipase
MTNNDAHAIRQAGKLFKKIAYNPKTPIKTLRANYDALFGSVFLPNNIDRKTVDLGNIEGDFLDPELALGKCAILYAHGGGFVAGSRAAARNLCASLAHESACKLLLPEYRLAPEHPYPTALEDLYAAYGWLLRQGFAGKEIIVAGDGSGGNLAISLTHYLAQKNAPLPAGVVAYSPWVDLACESTPFQARKSPDPVHSRDMLAAYATHYTYKSNFTNPQVSPVLADFAGFPPLFIQCGSEEILLDDIKRLAAKATKSGVAVTTDIEDGMWHLFEAIDSLTPRARLAVQRTGKWIRERLADESR